MSGSSKATLTQCPHCDTVFQVSDEQLQVAQGRVRCGRCQGVFDALAHLFEQADENPVDAPEEPHTTEQTWETDEPDDTPYIIASRDDDEPFDEAPPEPPDAAPAEPIPDTVDATATEPESTATATDTAAEPAPDSNLAETLPPIDIVEVLSDQLREVPPAAAAPRSFFWSLLAGVLLLGLAGQYLFFARADLSHYEALRPWLQSACSYLGCELPLIHAPEQIELLSRDVISHPRIRKALLINASFVNRATHAQVYPVLQISLSNESGTVVAMRRFQPEEYLAQGARIAMGMQPGAPVRVVLEVAEPKQDVTSFQFEFL